MNQLNGLIDRMRADVAVEVAEWDALDATRIQEQIKKRGGKRETIEGFYVYSIGSCDAMQLMKNESWPTSTLYNNHGYMTIFTHEERAQEAITQTKKKIEEYKYLPENMEVHPVGRNNIWHFLDDDSKTHLCYSSLIDICEELPSPLTKLDRLKVFLRL